jgi:acetate kinase
MKILIMNCGSSSVKFQLIDVAHEELLAKGVVERIGSSDAIINYQSNENGQLREVREVLNHEDAIEIVIALLLHPQHGVIKSKKEIDGIGHRVVHGGEAFFESALITEPVKVAIEKFIQFAPLHNPHNLKGIEACERLLPGAPQVAVFDTAFHHTIPPNAYVYGLPYAFYKKLGIRRYGFHGTSHRYVSAKAAEFLAKPAEVLKLITCHLGNGASITAVDGGKSVDTSMGFTPLEGLIMGTRCGDIDPALVPYIMEKENLNTKQIDTILNKNSGMLGLTGTSNDMREIIAEAARGSEQHQLAIEIYCYRVKKYIGAYMAALGRVDAIVFTGGIGENCSVVRDLTLQGMDHFGISVDPEKNKKHETDIGTGSVRILVIPTNEELAIGRDTAKILQKLAPLETKSKVSSGRRKKIRTVQP